MELNKNYFSRYRKKRLLTNRKDFNLLDEINLQFSVLNLNKKQKICRKEYINKEFKFYNDINLSANNFIIGGKINMESEKKFVESYYKEINKILFNSIFNKD